MLLQPVTRQKLTHCHLGSGFPGLSCAKSLWDILPSEVANYKLVLRLPFVAQLSTHLLWGLLIHSVLVEKERQRSAIGVIDTAGCYSCLFCIILTHWLWMWVEICAEPAGLVYWADVTLPSPYSKGWVSVTDAHISDIVSTLIGKYKIGLLK